MNCLYKIDIPFYHYGRECPRCYKCWVSAGQGQFFNTSVIITQERPPTKLLNEDNQQKKHDKISAGMYRELQECNFHGVQWSLPISVVFFPHQYISRSRFWLSREFEPNIFCPKVTTVVYPCKFSTLLHFESWCMYYVWNREIIVYNNWSQWEWETDCNLSKFYILLISLGCHACQMNHLRNMRVTDIHSFFLQNSDTNGLIFYFSQTNLYPFFFCLINRNQMQLILYAKK